jgi:hypothetical protein
MPLLFLIVAWLFRDLKFWVIESGYLYQESVSNNLQAKFGPVYFVWYKLKMVFIFLKGYKSISTLQTICGLQNLIKYLISLEFADLFYIINYEINKTFTFV